MRIYLDASAIVKLIKREPETAAVRAFLKRHARDDLVTSALSRTEVVRAVLAEGSVAVAHAREVLDRLAQVTVSRSILDSAALLETAGQLRTLDAIHLATAQRIGTTLRAVVTYDARMAAAADDLAIAVSRPG